MTTATVAMTQTLPECLRAFVQSANAHPRVGKLLKGWEPLLLIEATDDGQRFNLRVHDARLDEVALSEVESDNSILVRGSSEVLREVFSGTLNPARAYLEGTLEVFGSDRDHIKLDAISLVLWGM
jgi:hypothetical protein